MTRGTLSSFFVFALAECKNEKQKMRKYHAAARPEFTEGQAKNHVD
jgi:hypothetical protein